MEDVKTEREWRQEILGLLAADEDVALDELRESAYGLEEDASLEAAVQSLVREGLAWVEHEEMLKPRAGREADIRSALAQAASCSGSPA